MCSSPPKINTQQVLSLQFARLGDGFTARTSPHRQAWSSSTAQTTLTEFSVAVLAPLFAASPVHGVPYTREGLEHHTMVELSSEEHEDTRGRGYVA